MKLHVVIEMDSAAFVGNEEGETARILREFAKRLDNHQVGFYNPRNMETIALLPDANGTLAGVVKLIP